MSVASLSLLKGAKGSAIGNELEKAPPPVGETEVVVDIDKMDTKQLNALVAEHSIEVPDTWAKMTVAKKKGWLKSQFEETDPDLASEVAAEIAGEAAAELATQESVSGDDSSGKVVLSASLSPEVAAVLAASPTPEAAEAHQELAAIKKGKKVAKASLSGEVLGPDPLSDLVHEIENLTEKQALQKMHELTDETEASFFKMGGVLAKIMENHWYKPHDSFRKFVENEHGMHYRKALYQIEIYDHLVTAGIPWAKVKGIGWSKLKDIAAVITQENVDVWVKAAMENNVPTLIEMVKAAKATTKPAIAIEDQTAKLVMTKTFKVHEDQKVTIETAITKAKTDSGTTVDTVALEFICLDFLGGQTLVQKFKNLGIEKVLSYVEQAFPNAKIDVELTDTEQAA